MSGIIVTGLWGAGKTTYIRNHVRQLLDDGHESLSSIGAGLLSGQIVAGCTIPYQTVCRNYVDRLVADQKSAGFSLRTSSRRATLMHQWIFDGLMFNVPLYAASERREEYLPLEQRLSENDTVVKYLYVPPEMLMRVCFDVAVADRGQKWKLYLERISLGYDGGVEQMLQARTQSLEDWLFSSPLQVDVIERAIK